VQRNKFECFHTKNEYLEESGKAISESDVTTERFSQQSFEEYFPANNNDNNWPKNPFIGSIKEYIQLIDIVSDSVMKQTLLNISLSRFPASLTEEYPEISKRVVGKLLPPGLVLVVV
jgi:hypothetical protein